MQNLDIYLHGELVAHAEPRSKGTKAVIQYSSAVHERYGDEVPLLSCSIPTPGPSTPNACFAFLEGELPEGQQLRDMASTVEHAALRGDAPVSVADACAMLAVYGRECAGAVAFYVEGDIPSTQTWQYSPISPDEIAALIAQLPQHPLGDDLERDIRISLGGVQAKLLLAHLNGQWFEAIGGAPTTHILKPTQTWKSSALNEAFVMQLAAHAQLCSQTSSIEVFGERQVLVTERFDRNVEDGSVTRHHQEDFCQALGVRTKDKYDIKGLHSRIAQLLLLQSVCGESDVVKAFRYMAFRTIIGDEDGHAKNYGIMHREGEIWLSPIYDSLCTMVYPELSGKLAASIGRQVYVQKVDLVALIEEGRAMMLRESLGRQVVLDLCDTIQNGLEPVLSRMYTKETEVIYHLILRRIDKLRANKPMGDASGYHLSL